MYTIRCIAIKHFTRQEIQIQDMLQIDQSKKRAQLGYCRQFYQTIGSPSKLEYSKSGQAEELAALIRQASKIQIIMVLWKISCKQVSVICTPQFYLTFPQISKKFDKVILLLWQSLSKIGTTFANFFLSIWLHTHTHTHTNNASYKISCETGSISMFIFEGVISKLSHQIHSQFG